MFLNDFSCLILLSASMVKYFMDSNRFLFWFGEKTVLWMWLKQSSALWRALSFLEERYHRTSRKWDHLSVAFEDVFHWMSISKSFFSILGYSIPTETLCLVFYSLSLWLGTKVWPLFFFVFSSTPLCSTHALGFVLGISGGGVEFLACSKVLNPRICVNKLVWSQSVLQPKAVFSSLEGRWPLWIILSCVLFCTSLAIHSFKL